jgi:hypothetical protein
VREVLDGRMRRDIVAGLSRAGSLHESFGILRHMMRDHLWKCAGRSIPMAGAVRDADAATRRDGFHALNDWDGVADHVNAEIIPVDVLDYIRALRPDHPSPPVGLAILVDYYFFHIVSLLSLRVWDTGDPPAALRTVGELLDALQGPDGSGQLFVSNTETLLLIATSHYEPDEHGFGKLLGRMATLDQAQQDLVALGHAACLGAHLRFGFLATYGRQPQEMRADNQADYPWLGWAVATVLRRLESLPPAAIEALFGGLTADTEALLTHEPVSSRLRPLLPALLPMFEALAPTAAAYSPLSLFFNFSHNLIKGTVVDAILREEPWRVSYNDLLTGASGGASPLPSREALARTLMEYARRSPQRIRGELLPVIVYDPESGRARHAAAMSALSRV